MIDVAGVCGNVGTYEHLLALAGLV